MTIDDESVVSYSVRELFERVDGKLTAIDHKLDSKADQADVDDLRRELLSFRLWRAKFIGVVVGIGLGSGLAGASISRAVLGGG